MRTVGISMMFALLVSGAAACGGDDGGDGGSDNNNDDTADNTDDITVDDTSDNTDNTDGTLPDAPTGGLTGLGQACVVAMQGADCPSTTDGCLSYTQGATMGICTKICIPNGTFSTDAQSAPTNVQPADFDAAGGATCTGAYTGTVGTAICDAIVNVMPAPPLQPNTNYTFLAACSIECGAGNTCPSGLTCVPGQTAELPSICQPN
jgi:hypothetical protein